MGTKQREVDEEWPLYRLVREGIGAVTNSPLGVAISVREGKDHKAQRVLGRGSSDRTKLACGGERTSQNWRRFYRPGRRRRTDHDARNHNGTSPLAYWMVFTFWLPTKTLEDASPTAMQLRLAIPQPHHSGLAVLLSDAPWQHSQVEARVHDSRIFQLRVVGKSIAEAA